jgi:hypothetical protein
MNKFATRSATVLLTGTLVFGIFAAIAALDEFVRLPFYHTLTVATLLMNAGWLYLVFGQRIRLETYIRPFARLTSTAAGLLGRLGSAQPQFSHASSDARTQNARSRRSKRPSQEEIETALGKIHSVAWGFPTQSRVVDSINQEAQTNHETRQ